MSHPEIPAKVQIGGLTYRILEEEREDAGEEGLFGFCDRGRQEITLYPHHCPDNLANTILHEVLHAIWGDVLLDHSKAARHEEHIVSALTNGLCATIRNNPGLLRAIEGLMAAEPAPDDEEVS